AVGGAAGAADFAADMVVTAGGRTMLAGKIRVQGTDKVRQEVLHEGAAEPMVTIIRLDRKVVWTLLPGGRYLEFPGTAPPGQPGFTGPVKVGDRLERVTAGAENVNGYACDVFHYVDRERRTVVLTEWKARELDYVIKTELIDPETPGGRKKLVTEYRNIKREPQPDALFELPPGAEKLSLPGLTTFFDPSDKGK
ncbi:MAG TPA: hypothetical protein GXX28_08350, partial [Firmicutes bacterium]|nr:hypothetical protein [Bacillota bacterium]